MKLEYLLHPYKLIFDISTLCEHRLYSHSLSIRYDIISLNNEIPPIYEYFRFSKINTTSNFLIFEDAEDTVCIIYASYIFRIYKGRYENFKSFTDSGFNKFLKEIEDDLIPKILSSKLILDRDNKFNLLDIELNRSK